MRIELTRITPLVAAGAAAVALFVAPTVAASPAPPLKTCVATGGGTTCQSPGNVEINTAAPVHNPGPGSIYGPFFTYNRGRR